MFYATSEGHEKGISHCPIATLSKSLPKLPWQPMPQLGGPVSWYQHYLPRIDFESPEFYTEAPYKFILLKTTISLRLKIEKNAVIYSV